MLRISQLFVYPIKSLRGISLSSSMVTDRGLQYDRRWMLVDENNSFLTLREYPKMTLLKVELHNEGLKIESLEKTLAIDLASPASTDHVSANDCQPTTRINPTPRFSLVVPAFNEANWLNGLLDTVDIARRQYRGGAYAIEVIVADNASTDATAAIAHERGCRVAHVEKRAIAA